MYNGIYHRLPRFNTVLAIASTRALKDVQASGICTAAAVYNYSIVRIQACTLLRDTNREILCMHIMHIHSHVRTNVHKLSLSHTLSHTYTHECMHIHTHTQNRPEQSRVDQQMQGINITFKITIHNLNQL